MCRLGRHHDSYAFTDTASFKAQTGGRTSARHVCKAFAHADKVRERTATPIALRNPEIL